MCRCHVFRTVTRKALRESKKRELYVKNSFIYVFFNDFNMINFMICFFFDFF